MTFRLKISSIHIAYTEIGNNINNIMNTYGMTSSCDLVTNMRKELSTLHATHRAANIEQQAIVNCF